MLDDDEEADGGDDDRGDTEGDDGSSRDGDGDDVSGGDDSNNDGGDIDDSSYHLLSIPSVAGCVRCSTPFGPLHTLWCVIFTPTL